MSVLHDNWVRDVDLSVPSSAADHNPKNLSSEAQKVRKLAKIFQEASCQVSVAVPWHVVLRNRCLLLNRSLEFF